MIAVRRETPADHEAIHRVEREAFGHDAEASLVDALRDGGNLVLSLVAEDDGEIVGHVAFSPMTIKSTTATHRAIGLGPIAVLPSRQKQGIGGMLIHAGVKELRTAGESAIFLLGHLEYYPRFGFQPALGFDVHYQNDRENFMALELQPGALDRVSGDAHFAPEFAPFE